MKKIIFIIAACAIVGGCFNGCARNAPQSSEDTEIFENNAVVENPTTKVSEKNEDETETEVRERPIPHSSASAENGFRFISVAFDEKDYECVFDNPSSGIVTATWKNANHDCLNVIYVSEMLLVSPDFAEATRSQYTELIMDAYGVSEYDTLTINDISWQCYRISERHSAYVSVLEDCALYVEFVGTGDYETAGLAYIRIN